ncbi:MAG TPA: cytochrome c [Burkholderiales bacterium]|nr:cytochrome c [Burkholderiales bacterium]
MYTPKPPSAALLALALVSSAAFPQTPGLGKPISEADVRPWDIAIMPDGTGLPPGSGTAVQGARVFAEKCAACHGEGGKGGPLAPARLFGGAPLTNGIDTPKTIGNFWGYSTIVFDFVRRAMPFNQPRTLTNDEVYAATAYLLYLNQIIGENDVMNASTLPKVQMPNRDGFIIRFPDKI